MKDTGRRSFRELCRWILLGSGAAAHFAHSAPVYQAPDPRTVSIRSIAYAGSGCPAGTVASNMAGDAKAFTLLFDSYVAEAGPDISLAQSRKNCQVVVDLKFPTGYSFSLIKVDYRGYASLDAGTTGVQKTNYYFQGQSVGPSLTSTFHGPYNDDYQARDTLAIDAAVWSPCGASRALNLNTQVRVTASGRKRALMTLDSLDGQIEHVYGILWRKCS